MSDVAVVVVLFVEDDVVEDADKGVSKVAAEAAAAKASIGTKGVVVVVVKVKVEEVRVPAGEAVGSEREVTEVREEVGCVVSTEGSVVLGVERVVAIEPVLAVALLFLKSLSLLLVEALV